MADKDIVVDTRGLSCPQPLILAQDAIRRAHAGDIIEIISDNPAAKDNIVRYAKYQGCSVDCSRSADDDDGAQDGGAKHGRDEVDFHTIRIKVGDGN